MKRIWVSISLRFYRNAAAKSLFHKNVNLANIPRLILHVLKAGQWACFTASGNVTDIVPIDEITLTLALLMSSAQRISACDRMLLCVVV